MAKGWVIDEKQGLWLPESVYITGGYVKVLEQVVELIKGFTKQEQEQLECWEKGKKPKYKVYELLEQMEHWCKAVRTLEVESKGKNWSLSEGCTYEVQESALWKMSDGQEVQNECLLKLKKIAFSANSGRNSPIVLKGVNNWAYSNKERPKGLGQLEEQLLRCVQEGQYNVQIEHLIAQGLDEYKKKIDHEKKQDKAGRHWAAAWGANEIKMRHVIGRNAVQKVMQHQLEHWYKQLGWKVDDGSEYYKVSYLVPSKAKAVTRNAQDEKELKQAMREHNKSKKILKEQVDWRQVQALLESVLEKIQTKKGSNVHLWGRTLTREEQQWALLDRARQMTKQWEKRISISQVPEVQWVDQQSKMQKSVSIALYVSEPYADKKEGFWTGSALSTNVNNAKLFSDKKEAERYTNRKFVGRYKVAFIECMVMPKGIESVQGDLDVSGLEQVLSEQEHKILEQTIKDQQEQKQMLSQKVEQLQGQSDHWRALAQRYEQALREAQVELPKLEKRNAQAQQEEDLPKVGQVQSVRKGRGFL